MSDWLLQLSNESLWRTVFTGTFQHQPGQVEGTFIPIVVTSPIAAETRVIRVLAQSISAKPYWRKACDFYAFIPTGTNQLEIGSWFITLGQPKLLIMPEPAGAYTFKIRVPWWIADLSLFIEEYTGEIDRSTDRLIRDRTGEILDAFDNLISLL